MKNTYIKGLALSALSLGLAACSGGSGSSSSGSTPTPTSNTVFIPGKLQVRTPAFAGGVFLDQASTNAPKIMGKYGN